MLTPFPGTLDFEAWEKNRRRRRRADRRHPDHPALADPAGAAPEDLHGASGDVARGDPHTHAGCGTSFTASAHLGALAVRLARSRLAFVLISKLYRQMYANTGIATDSARVSRSIAGRG